MTTDNLLTRAFEREVRAKPAIRGLAAGSRLERGRILKIIDLVVLNSAVALGFALSGHWGEILAALPLALLALAVISFIWLLLAETFDAYQPEVTHKPSGAGWTAFFVTLAVAGLACTPALLLSPEPWPHICATAAGWALILSPLTRALLADALASTGKRKALLVASQEGAGAVAAALATRPAPDLDLLGYVDGRSGLTGERGSSLPYLGSISRLGRALESEAPDVVAVEPAALERYGEEDGLQALMEREVEVVPLAAFYAEISGRLPASLLSEVELEALLSGRLGERRWFRAARRALDVVWVLVGLAGLFLATPFIALAIYLDSPGPIFYTQTRVGKDGKPFRAYKFRSMIPGAEDGKARWAGEEDRRITPVGRLLRKTHLDEFPQFINILKGEMSPVGPRPERPAFVEKFKTEIPFYDYRHLVRPGMAGWGLVNMGYAASEEDARQKHEYDLYYIQHQSLWLDLVILMKTFVDTVTMKGR
jgi:exopolysaccharide biosynthesis polyprenyl glycosylphosphotransferase